MQQVTDQHAALHTMCQMLSPASCSDFRARFHELFAPGEDQGALALWASCVEIQHFPPMPDREPEYPGLPPVRVRPCTQSPCARCEGRRGGYQFLFIGPHCRAAVLVTSGDDPARAWARYHDDRTRLTRLQVAEAWSTLYPEQVLPLHADRLLQVVGRQAHPRAATLKDTWWVWRAWHAGHYEPAFEAVPSVSGAPQR